MPGRQPLLRKTHLMTERPPFERIALVLLIATVAVLLIDIWEVTVTAGLSLLLDAYQAIGTVPVDVRQSGVDLMTGGSVKWLCGGPGAAWLYVRPDHAETLEPALTGWQAHEQPFAFEPEMRYAEGAQRFLTGTPNVPALYAATAGYDVIEEIGVDAIRSDSVRKTELLISLVDAAGFEVMSPRDAARRGGTVSVRVPEFQAVHPIVQCGRRGEHQHPGAGTT